MGRSVGLRVMFLPLMLTLTALLLPMPATVSTKSNLPPAYVLQFKTHQNQPDPNVIFARVNKLRAVNGLRALEPHIDLARIARQRADDMAARLYYAHTNTEGMIFSDLIAKDGIQLRYGCENLDRGFTRFPETYVRDWMASNAGHRECLLSPEVDYAGYAAVETSGIYDNQGLQTGYIIVAIHAALAN